MNKVVLPPLPQFHTHGPVALNPEGIRARDLEVARVVLEAAAKLKADAMEIFNSNPAMTPQETRDVIEWYSASLGVLEFTHAE